MSSGQPFIPFFLVGITKKKKALYNKKYIYCMLIQLQISNINIFPILWICQINTVQYVSSMTITLVSDPLSYAYTYIYIKHGYKFVCNHINSEYCIHNIRVQVLQFTSFIMQMLIFFSINLANGHFGMQEFHRSFIGFTSFFARKTFQRGPKIMIFFYKDVTLLLWASLRYWPIDLKIDKVTSCWCLPTTKITK